MEAKHVVNVLDTKNDYSYTVLFFLRHVIEELAGGKKFEGSWRKRK